MKCLVHVVVGQLTLVLLATGCAFVSEQEWRDSAPVDGCQQDQECDGEDVCVGSSCQAPWEDADQDGLSNAFERQCGTDPAVVDSDNNGVDDSGEDSDNDGLSNWLEQETGCFCGEIDAAEESDTGEHTPENPPQTPNPGICEPGVECGGLSYCRDDCYTEECCYLTCDCSDGYLECALYC